MAEAVFLPKVGMTMEEGTVARWLVPDGAEVQPGMPIFELETEKVNMEVEAEAAGVLRQLVPEDTKLKPGDVVACILAAGEVLPPDLFERARAQLNGAEAVPGAGPRSPTPAAASEGTTAADVPTGRVRITPIARNLAAAGGIEVEALAGTGPGGRITEADVRRAIAARTAAGRPTIGAPGRVFASPIARRIAAERGIDIAGVPGSGPEGRVTERDVLAYAEGPSAADEPVAAPAGLPQPPADVMPYKGRRRTIGERMLESLQSMAQLTLSSETPVDEAVRMMHGLNREWRREGVVVTLTALSVRACALALRDFRHLNSRLEGDAIVPFPAINVGVAVDLEQGLMVPVIRNADTAGLKEVAARLRDLSEKARENRLTLDDVSEGTFTVTSLETSIVDAFTPVINPPQAAILGIGRTREVAVFEAGAFVRGQVTTLSLTFDHRISDGAPAARFLARIAELLGRPYLLM